MKLNKVDTNMSTPQLRHINLDSLNAIENLPIKPIDDFLDDPSDYISFSFSIVSLFAILSLVIIILFVKAKKCVFRKTINVTENLENISMNTTAPIPHPRLRIE